MDLRMQPIHSVIDLTTGKIAKPAEYTARRISDLKGFFQDQIAAEEAVSQGDRIVYEVNEFAVSEVNGQLLLGTTIVHPGRVGSEYFMTKGHFHFKEDVAEVFVCLGGEGRVLLQTKEGEALIYPMKVQNVVYSPPFMGHRIINCGADKLIVLTIGQADAGHDYGLISKRGMARLVVERGSGVEVITNPSYQV